MRYKSWAQTWHFLVAPSKNILVFPKQGYQLSSFFFRKTLTDFYQSFTFFFIIQIYLNKFFLYILNNLIPFGCCVRLRELGSPSSLSPSFNRQNSYITRPSGPATLLILEGLSGSTTSPSPSSSTCKAIGLKGRVLFSPLSSYS